MEAGMQAVRDTDLAAVVRKAAPRFASVLQEIESDDHGIHQARIVRGGVSQLEALQGGADPSRLLHCLSRYGVWAEELAKALRAVPRSFDSR